jgi:pilus assembly protein CpaB
VFSAVLKNGRRALTIEVDEISSISGLLRPGDRIDLMLTAKASETGSAATANAREFTFPMLSNVEILATGQAQKAKPAAGDVAAQGFSHITLDVTPQEGTRIIAAKAAGRLTAVLRGPDDRVPNPSRALSIDDVVASIAPTTEGQRRMVEFIIGGNGGAGQVSSTPALDAAMKDPGNRAIAERVALNTANGGGAPPAAAAPAAPVPGAAPAARPGYPAPITPPAAAAVPGSVPVRR